MLTGKAKDLFKYFLIESVYFENEYHYDEDAYNHFDNLKYSMQWGVYQDFADSLGLFIDLQPCPCHNPPRYDINIDDRKNFIYNGHDDLSRNEAIQKAIEKLNEIINNYL